MSIGQRVLVFGEQATIRLIGDGRAYVVSESGLAMWLSCDEIRPIEVTRAEAC